MMWGVVRLMTRSRRFGAFLCLLGFVWGIALINMSLVATPTQRNSEELKKEILDLSAKYVKQLASETQDTIDGPYAGRLTGYDLKKTMAVLLENIMNRMDVIEHKLDYVLQNQSIVSQDALGRLPQSPVQPPRMLMGQKAPDSAEGNRFERDHPPPSTPGVPPPATQAPLINMKDLILGAQEDCSLKEEERKKFPHCLGKTAWMKDHWESDKCYSLYGVDGSMCSFRVYLSEVENWCPLLPGRSPMFLNVSAGSGLKRRANINTDLDGLLKKLKDPVNRQQNYAWIKQRITRMWPGWVAGAEELRKKQNMEGRQQKKVLVHLGLLSKKSGFKIAENSFKGGPLGELVQWSDIISALYILGHDLIITSEVEQLAAILGKLPAVESMCQTRTELPIDMIYIDIVGLTQFKRRVKAGYGKFSCLVRVIDSFGTEPAYNYEPYAKAHRLKTTWGMQNLNPQQFYTMFPHSPDNSFMGFVVEQHLNDSVTDSGIARKDQAVAYGKAEYMWQGKEDYLGVMKKYVDIHGTVFLDDPNKPHIIPSFVHNHGILSGPDLHRLLRESKIFIGLGFPYEGPAPLEAIAQGCVYINPKFPIPHNSQNTKFFKGKPTNRKVTSQHPYAEDFIGEPNVMTVDVNDKQLLEAAIKTALDNMNQGLVKPYMPYEFTQEGMLQRLHAYVTHQDFCTAESHERWPPDSAISVVLAQPGESCKGACQNQGLICELSYFNKINSIGAIEKYSGKTCSSNEELDDIYFPAISFPSNRCFLQKQTLLFSCVGEISDLSRICPCRDFLKGQSALCKDCL